MARQHHCPLRGCQLCLRDIDRLDPRAILQHQGVGQYPIQVGLQLLIGGGVLGSRDRREAGDDERRPAVDIPPMASAVGDDRLAHGIGLRLAGSHEGGRELMEHTAVGQELGLVARQTRQEVPAVFRHIRRAEEVDQGDVVEAQFKGIFGVNLIIAVHKPQPQPNHGIERLPQFHQPLRQRFGKMLLVLKQHLSDNKKLVALLLGIELVDAEIRRYIGKFCETDVEGYSPLSEGAYVFLLP